MKNLIQLSLISILAFTACNVTKDVAADKNEEKSTSVDNQNNSATAIYWQQSSAEYKALCYQAFNIATQNLIADIEESSNIDYDSPGNASKPKAIIMDLDETVFDNSPFNGFLFQNNLAYDYDLWREWTQLARATIIPGAQEFIKKTQQMNVPIFFISNRTEEMLGVTLQNLAEQGVEVDEEKVLLFKRVDNGKIERRGSILMSFDVVMLIGDNLADFSDVFELAPELEQRNAMVKDLKEDFGRKFIILPNVMYGDWMPSEENEVDPNRTQAVKDLAPYINSYE